MHHVSNQAYLIVYFLINSDQFACNQYLFNSKAKTLSNLVPQKIWELHLDPLGYHGVLKG